MRYNADAAPDPAGWLAADENERLKLVSEYHERHHIASPSARLHAALHVVVENQLALGEKAVRETVERLQARGLSRHEALHRIGAVVTEVLLEATRAGNSKETSGRTYEERLAALLAEE